MLITGIVLSCIGAAVFITFVILRFKYDFDDIIVFSPVALGCVFGGVLLMTLPNVDNTETGNYMGIEYSLQEMKEGAGLPGFIQKGNLFYLENNHLVCEYKDGRLVPFTPNNELLYYINQTIAAKD